MSVVRHRSDIWCLVVSRVCRLSSKTRNVQFANTMFLLCLSARSAAGSAGAYLKDKSQTINCQTSDGKVQTPNRLFLWSDVWYLLCLMCVFYHVVHNSNQAQKRERSLLLLLLYALTSSIFQARRWSLYPFKGEGLSHDSQQGGQNT